MTIFNVLELIGGLALFLYGMHVMGQALEKSAGGKLKNILSKLTSSPIKGLLLGAGVTAVIQSSSATTVMVIGFVNSGLMQLRQAIGVIMGANIGTTITPWILSLSGIESSNVFIRLLKPSSFTPILAIIGIFLIMMSKREKRRDIGSVLLGFAVLMFGMDTMSAAVAPLSNIPEFTQLFVLFSNPVLGVIIGALLTAIIQSSSASVGILQALSMTGSVTFGSAIPIIMGQNIGTCITAIISSFGANKNARRAALVHLYFNIIGAIVCLTLFYTLNALIGFEFLSLPIDALGIAIVHTSFNVACTAILVPFSKQLEMLAIKSLRDKNVDETVELLDERLIATPAIAVERSRKVTCDMANLSRESLKLAISLIEDYSEKNYQKVMKMEAESDALEDSLDNYLVQISSRPLSDEDSLEVYELLHTITDFERISDHAVNIAESAKEMKNKNLSFSDEAKSNIRIITDAVKEIVDLAVSAFLDESADTAAKVEPLEEVIDGLNVELKSSHVRRLQDGDCTIELGFIFNDLLANYERVADHCSNIAVCQIELVQGNFDPHAYLSELKSGNNVQFKRDYDEYRIKYSLPR